ncbi:MAG: hypothetical protein A4E66_02147 [Syntrophus sp. PtaB.Bin001]|nr:MAG: hypothetical protein A4E66_02147 [Syntrophus sp. PtaB.Bin001]
MQAFGQRYHALGQAADCGYAERPSDHDRIGAQGEHLENIASAADTAVHQYDDPPINGLGYARQDLGRPRSGIEDTAAVIGNHDGVGSGLQGQKSVFGSHDALDDEFPAAAGDNFPEFFQGLGRNRSSHLAQGDEPGGVDIHAEYGGAAVSGLGQLVLQFGVIPGLDERDAVPAGLGDGRISGLMDEIGHAVADAADDSGPGAAVDNGGDEFLFRPPAAHVEGHPADWRSQHGH